MIKIIIILYRVVCRAPPHMNDRAKMDPPRVSLAVGECWCAACVHVGKYARSWGAARKNPCGPQMDFQCIPFLSTAELAAAIKSRLVTSRQVLELLLARRETFDGPLNAVVYIDANRARQRADQADAALARGEDWGVLHGVPCTVKENNNWKGSPIPKVIQSGNIEFLPETKS